MKLVAFAPFLILVLPAATRAQQAEFAWVNPLPDDAHPRLSHGNFRSASMGLGDEILRFHERCFAQAR